VIILAFNGPLSTLQQRTRHSRRQLSRDDRKNTCLERFKQSSRNTRNFAKIFVLILGDHSAQCTAKYIILFARIEDSFNAGLAFIPLSYKTIKSTFCAA